MINIDINNGVLEDFTIILSDRSQNLKGQIKNIDEVVYRANLNSANEISFLVYKKVDNLEETLWDDIYDLRLIWVKELNEYFEITVTVSESPSLVKKVTGISLCESELSQSILRNLEINSEIDIERDDYKPTKFYDDSDHSCSLLHRVLEKVPHYSIDYVDGSLKNLQRTFSINNTSIYDFLTGECSEQFNCLFQFNSVNRTISVHDLYTVCLDCGYRGEYNDNCPKCNSTNLSYYGEDTTIFVSTDNLTDDINYETNVDSIKNCFKLEAGDEDMTSAIVACNPNGSSYLYYFSEEQKRDMPTELVDKLSSYDDLVNSYSDEYKQLLSDLYECIDKIIYYQSEMMPTIEVEEITASTEAAKLTVINLSPVGLTTVGSYTSTDTVNSALINLSRIFVKTGYVKVEVDTGNFTYIGADGNKHNYGNWTGRFKVISYSDETDIAYSDTLTIKVTDDYNYFLTQKIQKNIITNDDSVFDILTISSLDTFKNALTFYCYNRLESFTDAIQGVINVLIEENQSNSDSEYYNQFYAPYYNKLLVCQNEMNIRSSTIQAYKAREQQLINRKNEIQTILNFESYLGDKLFHIFCSYRREDTYRNDNFISDGLNNAEIQKKALDFIELAKEEIYKSGNYQHSISSNLYNLLVMEEFKPIINMFKLGNWIRCKSDNNIYRLRLISYEFNGKNLSSINTEFSDVTKTKNGTSDIQDILHSAQSIASTYSYVSQQAYDGKQAYIDFTKMKQDGLNSALINIKNNNNEEVIYDKNGILCRSFDDIENDYSSKQLKLTHNILAFTQDNWQTSSLAIGEHKYYYYDSNKVLRTGIGYGVTSDFVTAGFVNGSQIIGGEIFSNNYSKSNNIGTHFDLRTGNFELGNNSIVYKDGKMTFGSNVVLSWNNVDSPDDLATTGDIPTKVGQLINDSGYQDSDGVTTITKKVVSAPYIATLNLTVGNEIKMGENATISWNNVSSKPSNIAYTNDIPTDTNQLTNGAGYTTMGAVEAKGYETATSIKNTVITKDYIETLKVKAGSVAAENITGETITGKTLKSCSIQSAKGNIGGWNIDNEYFAADGIYNNRTYTTIIAPPDKYADTDIGAAIFAIRYAIGTGHKYTAWINAEGTIHGKNVEADEIGTMSWGGLPVIVSSTGDYRISQFGYSDNTLVLYTATQGNFACSVTSWSDSRLKKNIDYSDINGLKIINSIKHRKWDWKDSAFGNSVNLGYVAHELEEIIPEAVKDVKQDIEKMGYDSLKQIDNTKIIPYLTKAVQELYNLVVEQNKRIKKLEENKGE